MAKIAAVKGRQILDSRGNPTVEAEVVLDSGEQGRAAVPSGASTGSHEAVELRDGDPKAFGGKGVLKAVANVNGEIAQAIRGQEAEDQAGIDQALIALDGTPNKGRLGANAILAVSLAAAQAAARVGQQPLFEYVHGLGGDGGPMVMPMPMMNIVNGGKHAAGSTDIQEFMVVPAGAKNFTECVRMGAEVFHALKTVLHEAGYGTTVGDEGGFAPAVESGNREALDLISQAVEKAGYRLGEEIVFALDVAASELHQGGEYVLGTEGKRLDTPGMVAWLEEMKGQYPVFSIEDGLGESDWEGWRELTQRMGGAVQLVGDDLLVTNTEFLARAIQEKAANAILVKPNQIGTLTETIQAVRLAQENGWRTIISHRSGETEDVIIAHLAVGLGAGQIKTGSLSRTDRVAKYNELLRIEEWLGSQAVLADVV